MANSEIRSYQDLRVWQKGMEVAESCYRITKDFPKEEMYGMTSQIRRAATSIPPRAWMGIGNRESGVEKITNNLPYSPLPTPHSLMSEGYGREYRAEYAQFLRIAQGSLKELETHLILSLRVKLATSQAVNPILRECESLGKMLRSLIRSLVGNQ